MIFIALIISILAAVVPTLFYTMIFFWADRYEREPAWLLMVAFVWGAVPAIIVSLIWEQALGATFITEPGSTQGAIVEGVIFAPVIEELAKGAALLLIFWLMRHEFDGVLDGLLYGALIGFGFGMTENFFYFLGAFDEGGFSNLSVVIFLRALLFGMNHALYTSLAGMGLGFPRVTVQRWQSLFYALAGLLLAIGTHAVHNLGATLASINPLSLLISLALAAGGVGVIITAVVLSWRHEKSLLRRELFNEIGIAVSRQEYDTLLNGWHWPLRTHNRRESDQADRLALCVELAFNKARLRKYGPQLEPSLPAAIVKLQQELEGSATVV